MTPRLVTASALFVALFVAVAAVAGCGDDASSEPTLAPLLTTTTVPTTTSMPATTTTMAPATTPATAPTPATTTTTPPTTTTPATTTTDARAAALVLREDGLGDAVFGADADEVVGYIRSILGDPSADSGWTDPFASFGICPGTEVRGVTWGDLQLLFSDDSTVATGRRHFFNYVYGPAAGAAVTPDGLRTTTGIGIGSTVADLRVAHPSVQVYPEEIYGPYFVVTEHLTGFLTGVEDGDEIISFIGGVGCGE